MPEHNSLLEPLTPRERDVLRGMVEGWTNADDEWPATDEVPTFLYTHLHQCQNKLITPHSSYRSN